MAQASPPARVRHIPLARISPNPHNPRRLFDTEPMAILQESIRKLGVLVPVTVYQDKPKAQSFVLLDGERRWRCAAELGLEDIPSIVVETPDETRNVLTMFHIHNVREGWQLMPTALKLQTLMKTLDERNERNLAELTKLKVSQIRRCKILLTYPKKFQNTMLAPPDRRLKADFFIELQRIRGPALADRLRPWVERGDATSTQMVLDKYKRGTIKAVTEFRILAEIYRASLKQNKLRRFLKEFDRFLQKPERTIHDIEVPGATFAKEAKEIKRSSNRLLSQLNAVDLEMIASDLTTVRSLQKLAKVLQTKLEQALLVGVRDEAPDND